MGRERGKTEAGERDRIGAGEDVVPSRRQYLSLKAQHPGAILLYRMGDFYETFDDDAAIAARDARITLTSRSFGRSGRVPMAGIPHHALNHYLARLLHAGHTVAIAEQLSEPGKGLVERAVTRVVTPGTVVEPGLLPSAENRYLAAICRLGGRIGLAWADVSTGEFALAEFDGPTAPERLAEELARLNPAECLVPDQPDGDQPIETRGHRTTLERWHFEPAGARTRLLRQLRAATLEPFGCAEWPAATGAAGAILVYLERTNPRLLPLLTSLRAPALDQQVVLDAATRRNLELTHSLRHGGSRNSLFGLLDETATPMGARALRRLLGQPLRDLGELRRRQGIVAALVEEPRCRLGIRRELGIVGDLERLAGRVVQGTATIRDYLALAAALRAFPAIQARLRATGERALLGCAESLDTVPQLVSVLEDAVEEDAEQGALLRRGFAPELDAVRDAAHQTRSWLARLERSERERTGIRSLKVGFNKVFGYYIEVTRPNLPLVPGDYLRKQTVANGERYITAALKEAEARMLAAEDEIAALERATLARLAESVQAHLPRLLRSAEQLARLDALLALAEVAARERWVRPMLDESDALEIANGRHPVVEASLGGAPFIANDCCLGGEHPRQCVLTGPNMGGKSTFLRQVALIVLLAQVGSFVPAASARIGLVDRIFTRIGAHDDLPGGASTFMVEMVETAAILRQASARSLVILDEVGRGTSTQDGLALARAVLEDLHDRVGARTLFATHYLELTEVAGELSRAANLHVAASERDGGVIFLYAVRPGTADQAYGIHVARLAGLPSWVTERAAELLDAEPARAASPRPSAATPLLHEDGESYQLTLDGIPRGSLGAAQLARELRRLDVSQLTPGQAIDWLAEQQRRLGYGRDG
ncbi:MAG TPA: DNA mismatch repair protein MutS [Thermomicrobiaceae bacterium]|nr:DNA mismatch repair protein MutS [Thermomicrobiaceae bacterium]